MNSLQNDVTPDIVVFWNLRPACIPDGQPYLPVRIRTATNYFLLDVGAETFLGERNTFGKSKRARTKGINWILYPLNSRVPVAQGLDPAELISDFVASKESLMFQSPSTIQ